MASVFAPGAYGAADPLFLLLIALAIEAYLGGRALRLRWMPHPRAVFARLARELQRRLDRPERGARNLRVRGAVVTLGLAAAVLALAWLVQWLTRHYPLAWGFEVALLALLLDQRGTWSRAAAVTAALQAGSLVRAGEALRRLAGGGPELDAPGAPDAPGTRQVSEATVAALGRRFARGLLGPVFWYVLLGLPGLFLQQGVQVMAVAWGPGPGESGAGAFGQAARALDRALAVLPDYLAGLFLAAASAFVPGGQPLTALAPALKGRAGALGAALAALPASARLRPALGIFAVACLIDAGLIALLALARLGL